MADTLARILANEDNEPIFEFTVIDNENVKTRRMYLPIRRIAGLALALSTIVHDYPDDLVNVITLIKDLLL